MAFISNLVLLCCLTLSQGNPLKTGKNFLELFYDLKSNCSGNPLLDLEHLKLLSLEECQNSDLSKVDTTTLNCLVFLDLNRRLCEMEKVASFNLTERLKIEESKNLTVELVCSPDSGITFESIPESPQYKDVVRSIYSNNKACLKFCMSKSENPLDYGPNLLCKTLYHGSSIIRDLQNEVKKPNGIVTPSPLFNEMKKNPKESLKPTETYQQSKPPTQDEKPKFEPEIIENKPTVGSKPPLTTTIATKVSESSSNIKTDQLENHAKIPVVPKNVTKIPIVGTVPKDTITATSIPIGDPKKDYEAELNEDKANSGGEDNYDAFGENVFSNENNNKAENTEDNSMFNRIPELDKKELEILPQSEGSIDDLDDEGGFFPLFFFGVAAMVLMYIMYHNKNKIMGLIIEGRHSGNRRRTSRGHAYKRLDTLEQAMSTHESKVTPSKIIY